MSTTSSLERLNTTQETEYKLQELKKLILQTRSSLDELKSKIDRKETISPDATKQAYQSLDQLLSLLSPEFRLQHAKTLAEYIAYKDIAHLKPNIDRVERLVDQYLEQGKETETETTADHGEQQVDQLRQEINKEVENNKPDTTLWSEVITKQIEEVCKPIDGRAWGLGKTLRKSLIEPYLLWKANWSKGDQRYHGVYDQIMGMLASLALWSKVMDQFKSMNSKAEEIKQKADEARKQAEKLKQDADAAKEKLEQEGQNKTEEAKEKAEHIKQEAEEKASPTELAELKETAEKKAVEMTTYLKEQLPAFVQEMTGKIITKQQIDSIISKLRLKEQFADVNSGMSQLRNHLAGKEGKGHFWSILLSSVTLPMSVGMQLTGALVEEGVMTYGQVVWEMGEFGLRLGAKNIWLLGDSVRGLTWQVPLSKVGEAAREAYKWLPTHSERIIYRLIYSSKNNLILKALSEISALSTKALIRTAVESTEDIKKLSMIGKNHVGQFKEAIKPLEELVNILPQNGTSGFVQDAIKKMKIMHQELSTLTQGLEIAQQAPKQLPAGQTLWQYVAEQLKIKWITQCHALTAIESSKDLKSMQKGLGNAMKTITANGIAKIGWIDHFKALNIFSSHGLQMRSLIDFQKQIKGQCQLIETRLASPGLAKMPKRMLNALALWSSTLDAIDAWNKVKFAFNNLWEAKACILELKSLAKSSPDAIKALVGKIPIIAIGWLSLSKNQDKKLMEQVAEVSKDLMSLVPIIWPVYTIYCDSGFEEGKKLDTTSVGLSIGMIWYDFYALLKNPKDRKSLMKFFTSPLTDIADLAKMWAQGIYRGFKTTALFTKALVMQPKELAKELLKPRRLGKAAALALIAWWLYEWYEYLFDTSDAEVQKLLTTYKNDRKWAEKHLKETWKTMGESQQADLIQTALMLRMGTIQDDECQVSVSAWTIKVYRWTIPPRISGEHGKGYKDVQQDITTALKQLDPSLEPKREYYFGGAQDFSAKIRTKLSEIKEQCAQTGTSAEDFLKQWLWYTPENGFSDQAFQVNFQHYL